MALLYAYIDDDNESLAIGKDFQKLLQKVNN